MICPNFTANIAKADNGKLKFDLVAMHTQT